MPTALDGKQDYLQGLKSLAMRCVEPLALAYASIKRILPNTDEKQCASSPIKIQATNGVATKHSFAPYW